MSQKMSGTLHLQCTCAIFVVLAVASICVRDHTCWSNDCSAGEEFCVQECLDDEKHCLANYVSHSNGTISAVLFSCIPEENDACDIDTCVAVESEGGVFSCCCTGDLCNEIQGLTPGSVVTDPSFTTSIPTGTIPVRPPNHQICEFYNCSLVTDPTTQSCYHGYEVCAETLAGMVFDHDDHYCQALYRFNSTMGLYELFTKGCQYGIPRCADNDECFVDTDRGDPFLQCCCDGQLCNANVTFSDPSRVVSGGLMPGLVVCPNGFSLSDEDQASCVDVNECFTGAHLCEEPATCVNEVGTYRCECDATKNMRISNDGLRCEPTGLVCERLECTDFNNCLGGLEYCNDRFLEEEAIDFDAEHCQATYQLDRASASLEPLLLTCLIGTALGDCTHGYCDLQYVSEDILFCCCTGNLCNVNITFPDASGTSPTPSPGLTPGSMATDPSFTTSVPTEATPVRPPSPLSISFTGDTPRVVGNAITVEISLSRRARFATCRLGDTIVRDCFTGTTFRDVPPGRHSIRIKARNSRQDRATVTRKIEIGSEFGFCSTHLINDGVTVDGNNVTVEFGSVGPALSFSCQMDSQPPFSCTSPVVLEDVDAGLHRLRITAGGRSLCSTTRRQLIKFTVPRQ